MKRNYMYWVWCVLCVCALWSCGKDGTITGPKGPQGPPGDTGTNVYYGEIAGTVKVYDTTGKEEPSFAGVKVSIDSTNLSTITDAAGNFSFRHVAAGIYSLSFFKDTSYGVTRIVHVKHAGGAQATRLGNTDVGAIYQGPGFGPDFGTQNFGSPYNYQITYEGTVEYWIMHSNAIITFFGSDSAVSPTHYNVAQREVEIFADVPPGTLPPDRQPMWGSSQNWSQDLLRSDTAIIRADRFWFALVFDNPHFIAYTDERGVLIHPCVSRIRYKDWFPTYGFQHNPYNP